MSRVKFIADPILPEIRVNGHHACFPKRITEIRKVRNGLFAGVANGQKFQIEGGKAAGGGRFDWWVDWGTNLHGLYVRSLMEAIRTIENC